MGCFIIHTPNTTRADGFIVRAGFLTMSGAARASWFLLDDKPSIRNHEA